MGLLAITISYLSCTPAPSDAKRGGQFFDLPAFFEAEQQRMQSLQKVKKTVDYNGSVEERMIDMDSLDLEQEFKAFVESDINRASWLDKYAVDSVFNEAGQLLRLNYRSTDPKLKTKSVDLSFSNQQVDEIRIQNETGSYFSSSSQSLVYDVNEGYQIDSRQELILSSDRVLKVQVAFVD
ncbi:MAG: hypothetical protein AAFO94_09485 [Bacteroidota bacterium]